MPANPLLVKALTDNTDEPEGVQPNPLVIALLEQMQRDKKLGAPRTEPEMHLGGLTKLPIRRGIADARSYLKSDDFVMGLLDDFGILDEDKDRIEPAEARRKFNELSFEDFKQEIPSSLMGTTVGGRRIKVYPASALSEYGNLMTPTIIHEFLHSLGLGEKPHWPDAPTSREITLGVQKRMRNR
jgi:hypothetical protein